MCSCGHGGNECLSLETTQASLDEAVNQKKSLVNEIKCLREELQKVREDRDRQIAQVQGLTTDILRYKEATGKSIIELDSLAAKSQALQVCLTHFLTKMVPILESCTYIVTFTGKVFFPGRPNTCIAA